MRVRRICDEVQAHLPGLVAGTLPRWRRWLVATHVRSCDPCSKEHADLLARATRPALVGVGAPVEDNPPDWLLDRLLEQADDVGLRGRLAGPARGALSGARPVLSAVLLAGGAVAGSAIGYGLRRAAGAVRTRARRWRRH